MHKGIRFYRDCIKKQVLLGIGTPNCLVCTDNVVGVLVIRINKLNKNLVLIVGKRAKVMVLTGKGIFIIMLAKLSFISGRVVQLLNLVMRPLTIAVDFGTRNMTVHLKIGTPSILLIVIPQTDFPLVLI